MDCDNLSGIIGYRFRDAALPAQALTHSSYINEHKESPVGASNERLEFLGDAVLELIISRRIYIDYPDLTEGEMTKLRAGVVCEAMLSKKARALRLNEFLQMSKGETQSGGSNRDSTLCDAFEAVLGAVYLDGGFDAAEAFVLAQLSCDIAAMREAIWQSDCKTHLQELLQRNSRETIEYTVVDECGPDHDKSFTVALRHGGRRIGTGEGKSKKEAEQNAARDALRAMGL